MKKTILLLVAIFAMVACGKSDDSKDGGSSSGKFNPPAWIQGKWLNKSAGGNIGYEFAKNDICVIANTTTLCHGSGVNADFTTNVKEESTDKVYKVSFTVSGTIMKSYEFTKVSDKTITSNENPVLILTKK